MENCAFIDIFTTHNDLCENNNCPIQFCCEIFSKDEINDDDKLFNPSRRKIFNIIPDEKILTSGYINSGYNNSDIKTSDYNGLELKDALNKIYSLLKIFLEKDFFIIGYNHINYDLDILNKNFKRVLNLDPIEFKNDRIIDVMKLAEIEIPVTEIGNYTMDSVLTYLLGDYKKIENLRINKSTTTDIKITKMILRELLKDIESFSSIVEKINSPREIGIMSFGKYKGAEIKTVFENDTQYCNWLIKNKEISKQNPNLVLTLKKLMNTIVE